MISWLKKLVRPKFDVVYDIETFPNVFTMAVIKTDKTGGKIFEISERKNDCQELVDYIRELVRTGGRMVGFNNKGFDYPVMHYILGKAAEAKENGKFFYIDANSIYRKAMSVIEAPDDEKFAIIIQDSKEYVPQLDLYKIHHFDNSAKATSLKMLEFNMRSKNIEDLPFPVGVPLYSHQIDVLKKYNGHDVLETLKFYHETLPLIDMRTQLSEKYNMNFMNANDTKIGKDYFIAKIEEAAPGSCYEQVGGRRKMRQTHRRGGIKVKDIIFPYVKFERPEFQAVVDWFKAQTIKETKGVFTDILEKDLGEVAKYAEMVVKKEKLKTKPTEEEIAKFKVNNPLCWVEEIELKAKIPKKDGGGFKKAYWLNWNVAECLNVVVDGFRFDFGTGGIHGSIESRIVHTDEYKIIRDWDVASMYPNIAISNRVYPEHLGEVFCDIYEDVYNQRKSFAKGTPENAVMKLALNGVYGDSNNQYSVFYDPQYTMSITINGQLSLCMLAERLLKIEGVELIQVNTDGVTARIPRDKVEESDAVAKQWEQDVKLQLELAEYSMMAIRDVNNYIAVYTNGKIKRKGAYEYDGLGWHQDHGGLVIPMAAEHALVYGGSVEEFIYDHGDKWDFMLRTKVPRSSRLVLEVNGQELPQQNICRYYVSKAGGALVKIMPPLPNKEEERRIGIETGWSVKTCNNADSFEWDIDYSYYIEEARKLVDPLFAEKVLDTTA